MTQTSEQQIAALKYLISWAGNGSELLKKLMTVLVNRSERLTKGVSITLEAGDGFTAEEIVSLMDRFSGMVSAMGPVYINEIMVAMGSDFLFSTHCGRYDADGTYEFKTPPDSPMVYTFWLAAGHYGDQGGVANGWVNRKEVEAIDLSKPGLDPVLEAQVPPYRSRPAA